MQEAVPTPEEIKPAAPALAPKAPPRKPATRKPIAVKKAVVKTAPAKGTKAAPKVVPAPTSTTAKPVDKKKKPKMVRDSFTIPKAEYAVLAELKERAAGLHISAKKTELVRAGIKALAGMSDASFATAVKGVPNLKTGRPTKA
jgi:hypothetical protein